MVELLNKDGSKPPFNPVRINDLTRGRRYRIEAFRSISTKYGIKPIADLDTGESIYLPGRYSRVLPRQDVEKDNFEIKVSNTYLTYSGNERDKWRTAYTSIDI